MDFDNVFIEDLLKGNIEYLKNSTDLNNKAFWRNELFWTSKGRNELYFYTCIDDTFEDEIILFIIKVLQDLFPDLDKEYLFLIVLPEAIKFIFMFIKGCSYDEAENYFLKAVG